MAALLLMAGCGQPKAKEPVKKDIGLQLYSIRSVIGNPELYAANHEEAFKALAEMGYTTVEAANYNDGKLYGVDPAQYKADLEAAGLKSLSSHIGHNLSPEELASGNFEESMKWWDQAIAAHKAAGCKYIVTPSFRIPETLEGLKTYCDYFNEIGKKCAENGILYGYHNHSNDFLEVDGKMINDILIENTDPDLVAFEIDVAWAYRAGVDAAEYIRKHSGRFELIHVKETKAQMGKLSFMKPPKKGFRMERDISGWPKMTPEQAAEMDKFLSINCELGKGIVDMKAIKAAADAQGFTPYYIVERDYAWTGDIFTTLAADSGYLRAL